MSKKRKTLLPLLALLALFVTGALHRQTLFPSQPGLPAAVERHWQASSLPPAEVFAEFQRRHATPAWLGLEIWQRMHLEEGCFQSHCRLVRGPNHCARLEMKVYDRRGQSELLVVCDGETLARQATLAGMQPEVTTVGIAASPEPRDKQLSDHGCGGPAAVLGRLLPHLQKPVAQESSDGKRVRVVAQAGSESSGLPLPPGARLRWHLEFNATTYWLERLECLSPAGLVLEMEFRDPVTEPLSEDACAREFTFAPATR